MLLEKIFDAFEIRGVEITAQTRISVSGAKDPEGFLSWAECKPLITAIIKTGPRPRLMKIIFCTDSKTTEAIHENAQAVFLNMTYENNQVTFTTACAQKQFALDKSLDNEWDSWVKEFFRRNDIIISTHT
jgi:hypothetical protein